MKSNPLTKAKGRIARGSLPPAKITLPFHPGTPFRAGWLKVDHLKHLLDHGLAVEFADARLRTLVDLLAASDGEHSLAAGDSSLTLRRLGRCCDVVTGRDGILSRLPDRLHFFEKPNAGDPLKSSCAGDERLVAAAAIFGGGDLPAVLSPDDGAGRDRLAGWLRSSAWALAGESGLRELALRERLREAQARVAARKSQLCSAERARDSLSGELLASARSEARLAADRAREDEDRYLARAAAWRAEPTGSPLGWERVVALGALGAIKNWDSESGRFAGRAESWSHPLHAANRRATVAADGRITLSSGVACPPALSIPALLAFAGGGPAISTRYGPVERVLARDELSQPRTLLRCGCHLVAPGDFGAEVAAAFAPQHSITRTPATPSIDSLREPAAFAAEAARRAEVSAQAFRASRAEALRRLRYLTGGLPARRAAEAEVRDAQELLRAEEAVVRARSVRGPSGALKKVISALSTGFKL